MAQQYTDAWDWLLVVYFPALFLSFLGMPLSLLANSDQETHLCFILNAIVFVGLVSFYWVDWAGRRRLCTAMGAGLAHS